VSVKLNLPGRLKAGKVSAMANIAGARVGAGVLVSGKHRDSGHHQQGADREQRYVLAECRHWRRGFQDAFSIARRGVVEDISGQLLLCLAAVTTCRFARLFPLGRLEYPLTQSVYFCIVYVREERTMITACPWADRSAKPFVAGNAGR